MLRIGLLLSLALCVHSAQAELYKWVDAEGNVQFSNQPPPKDTEAETLKLQVAPSLEAPEPAPQEQTPPSGEQPQASGDGMTVDELRQHNCKAAQRNLDIFSGEPAGIMVKGADGKLRPIDAEQHKVKLAEAQQHVQQYCDPPADDKAAQ